MRKILNLLLFTTLSFNIHAQNLDKESLLLIGKAEEKMGQKINYDLTRHISWDFFGVRTLTWDKYTGDVRIDIKGKPEVYLINANTKEGKIFKQGQEVTHADSVSKYLQRAYEIWINDSYWLVMPFKLQDEGVTAKYLGKMKTSDDRDAKAIQLTFENTGVTPDNKYHIYFDNETGLVSQWDFYRSFEDEEPLFSMPWQNYIKYGKVYFSGDRGERKLDNIKVFRKLPESVYSSFEKPFFLK
ncbi:hypothetical protein [Jiulongibacter sp. NS-SX5]|uniref:hypothetical protein n=1 Tax=Jiulongibacter sp. NS-SX5 TaxID=3463854 RepID=UPI00405895D4